MTQSEGPLLVDTGSGLTIRYNGRNLYSPTAPIAAAKKRASAFSLIPQTLIFVPSPLLFYGIDDLLSGVGDDIHLLCVEVDQQLMRLSLDNTPESILRHPAISYIRTNSIDEVLRTLHRTGLRHFRRASELLVNGGSSTDRALYTRMFRAVEHEIHSYWRNRMTLMHMSHLWIKNLFRNFHSVATGNDVTHLHTNLPVVVAGAGESLEGAASLLRATRGQYFLLVVDTAVGTITDLGLRPDAVVVLDAQSANLADLVGFNTRGVDLVADVSAYPECVRLFSDNRWFFFSEFALVGLFRRARAAGLLPAAVPPLGSVGITALYCALAITPGPVLFVGLDFAFRPGKSHARGAPAHIAGLLRSGRLQPAGALDAPLDRPHRIVEGKTGAQLWTDSSLVGYSTSLNIFAEGKERIYDMGRNGLPNTATLISDPASVERLLNTWSSEPPFTGTSQESTRKTSGRKSASRPALAVRFLKAERALIEKGVNVATEAIRTGRVGASAPEELRGLISELDYVYLHFPDWSDDPIPTEGFLKRFVEAAETRAKWIEHGLSHFA